MVQFDPASYAATFLQVDELEQDWVQGGRCPVYGFCFKLAGARPVLTELRT
jgi:hypothetical protein